jgi:hypothetical protein
MFNECAKQEIDQNMFLLNLEPKLKEGKLKANEDEGKPTMTKISKKKLLPH